MSLTFSAELSSAEFTALVRRASSVQSKTSIPILDHALLKGDGKTLSVSSTNLDQAVTSQIPCEAQGVCTAPVSRLAAIGATLEKGVPVQLTATASELTVRHGRSRYALPTLPVDDFPAHGEVSGAELRAPAAELLRSMRDLLGTVIKGKDADAQPYFSGVFFDTRNGALVASNGKTLGRDIAPWCTANRDGFTLPEASTPPIRDLAGDLITIVADEYAATFSSGGVRVWTKFIGTPFPGYQGLIPKTLPNRWRIKTPDLARALKRVGLISKGGDNGVAVRCVLGASEIMLSARDQDGATAEDAIPCERLSGDDLTIGFGYRNIWWAVDSLNGEVNVEFQARGPQDITALSLVGDMSALRIVMPMMIG